MAYRCDLHLHTYYSDGRAAPEELVQHAATLGLKTIAITDHDNTRGAREALPVARALGIELMPGIEFTCSWEVPAGPSGVPIPRQDVDLLGYGMDWETAAFGVFETTSFNDAAARIGNCCARLTEAGLPVSLEDVLALNPRYPGAMQLIDTLVEKGYADHWDDALPVFQACWQHIPVARLDIAESIAAIHAAGGVAVLAHPTLVHSGDGWLKAEQLKILVEKGLDGVEVYHPRLNREAQEHFLRLARHFDLLVTGGSDEHGWPQGFPRLGVQLLGDAPLQVVEALRRRIQGRGGVTVAQ